MFSLPFFDAIKYPDIPIFPAPIKLGGIIAADIGVFHSVEDSAFGEFQVLGFAEVVFVRGNVRGRKALSKCRGRMGERRAFRVDRVVA